MSILDQARKLAGLGFTLVPVLHKTKHPAVNWKAYQTSPPTDAELETWFGSDDVGFAVVCGAASGNLAVLDFDSEGAYEDWCDAVGDLADALPSASSGRGVHVFIRTPSLLRSGRLYLDRLKEPVGDLLSEGKIAVLPPTLHPSGTERKWLNGIELLNVHRLESVGVSVKEPDVPSPPPRQAPKAPSGDRPGDDFNARTDWADVLEPFGWTYAGRSGSFHLWRRPGKTEGCSASICGELLHVFSSNAQPFEPGESYSKFGAFAMLRHGGDFTAATRDLASRGFGGTNIHHPLDRGRDDELVTAPEVHHNPYSLEDDEPPDPGSEPFADIFQSLPDYLQDVGSGEPDWILEGLLPATYLVILGGNSKAGKSTLATALGLAVASGEPFLGLSTKQGSVLWVAYEESEQERAMVLREFSACPSAFYVTHQKLMIDDAEGLAALRYWVERTKAGLLVIDPLYGANEAESLADGRKARQVLAGLKELCRETGVCALVLHHVNKNTGSGMVRERMADSNQILATASMDLLMDVTEQGDGSRQVRLVGHGRGSFANQTWVLRSESVSSWELVASGSAADVDSEYRDNQIVDAVTEAPEGLTAVQLAERTGVNEGTVRNRITVLVRDGRLMSLGKSGRANRYGPGPRVTTYTVSGPGVSFKAS